VSDAAGRTLLVLEIDEKKCLLERKKVSDHGTFSFVGDQHEPNNLFDARILFKSLYDLNL